MEKQYENYMQIPSWNDNKNKESPQSCSLYMYLQYFRATRAFAVAITRLPTIAVKTITIRHCWEEQWKRIQPTAALAKTLARILILQDTNADLLRS